MPIVIKRLNKRDYDVFADGKGWLETWTRIRVNHWGVSYVAGQRLDPDLKKQLNARFIK